MVNVYQVGFKFDFYEQKSLAGHLFVTDIGATCDASSPCTIDNAYCDAENTCSCSANYVPDDAITCIPCI